MAKKTSDADKISKMIAWAKKWLGVPYDLFNGKIVNGKPSKSVGIDCTRFVRRCYKHIGIKLPGGYPGPMYRKTKGKKFKVSKNKDGLSKLRAGDIIYFVDNNGKGKKGHATLYIGDGKIIHSNRHPKNGVQIQKLFVGKGAYRGGSRAAFAARLLSGGSAGGTSDSESGVDIYLKEARKHIGKGGKAWVKKHALAFHENAWCADTQCALMRVTKFAGKIGPDNIYTAGGFGKSVIEDYGGKYIKGPGYGGGAVTPKPGDFIESAGLSCSRNNKYSAGHIGVVEFVKDGVVHSIDGNHSDSYTRRTFKKNSNNILWYARPDWSRVGGDSYTPGDDSQDDTTRGGLLYDSLSTRADATLREVCYANAEGEPSLDKKEPYKLCVANYTTVLFWIVYAFGGTEGGESGDDDLESGDGNYTFPKSMNKNEKYVFNFLIGKGLNKAAVCGIMGNMKKENGSFTPGRFNGVDHYGICQWSSSRYGNTEHTIEAECNLLWKELTHGYKGVLNSLKGVKNTKSGCKEAAEVFCKKFEVCGNYGVEVSKRQTAALEYFNKIKLDPTSSEGDGKTVKGWVMPYKKGTTYYGNNDGDFLAQRSYERHPGIDLSTPSNRTVLAINGGTVIRAGWFGGYGNCVEIKHAHGYISRYGHASSVSVKVGQKVSAGQKIMIAGSTGHSYGVHLHLELHKNGKLVSPRTVLPIPDYTTNGFKQFKV